jgi:glycerate kinase
MKIVIAIDSFKGCASSNELAHAIKKGILTIDNHADIIICPIADGGEGTVEALSTLDETQWVACTCHNPLEEKIQANYILLKDNTAVMEMASASGLDLIPSTQRNPDITTTYGTGDLIKDAIHKGIRKFIIGIGGSATNDAGFGMLRSLGFTFYDNTNSEIIQVQQMNLIARIDSSNALKELSSCEFLIACDVNNPLCGENGASYVYGPQKGANEAMVKKLDKKLAHFAHIVEQDGTQYHNLPGAGAAGGLGFAFLSCLNATLKPGIELILQQVDFDHKIQNSDFVITGEGKIDVQSTMGKVIDGIGTRCKQQDVPCIALAGNCHESHENIHQKGITSLFSILDSTMSLQEAMEKETALTLIEKQTEQLFRLITAIKK